MKSQNFRKLFYCFFVFFTVIVIGYITSFYLVKGETLLVSKEIENNLENSLFEKPQKGFLNDKVSLFNNYAVINNLQQGLEPTYIGADNGIAFVYYENNGTTQHLKTSMPVFKAFGISSANNTLLYSPLKKRIPSGELFLENLEDGTATKITDDLILEAAFSPDESKIAYTFATGKGFGLAVANVDSKQNVRLISEDVLPDFFQWDISGKDVYYFETTNKLNTTGVIPNKISIKNKTSTKMRQELLPSRFPKLSPESSSLDLSSKEFSSTHSEIRYPFEIISPDKTKKVCGGNFFGSTFIQFCESVNLSNESYFAEGQILKVIDHGIIVRSFERNRTTINFVDWNGNENLLAASPQVSYNLPMSNNFQVTRSGTGYSNACGLPGISPHSGLLRFAFDMQKQITPAQHVMASAEGLIIQAVKNINCNSCDNVGCSPYCPGGANGGWGNNVIIQHADSSWSQYAHMQLNSVQVNVGDTSCQGLYLGNQGGTGCSEGSYNGCGDHLHFQRQTGSSQNAESTPASFSDVSSNPLRCITYNSGSTEVSSCSTCPNVTSTLRNNVDGGPPIHPPGSVLKATTDTKIYLIDSEGRKRWITSPNVLANLYTQSNSNFNDWVIIVGQDELNLYETGVDITSAQPGNGKSYPDGKIIRRATGGEISIVTGGGKQRGFFSYDRLQQLGFATCNIATIPDSDYDSYKPGGVAGPPVEAMPLLTASLRLYDISYVGQPIRGEFTIRNVGYNSLTLDKLLIGGRLNGSINADFPYVSGVILNPGQSYSYSKFFTPTTAGNYIFYVAHQEQNGHWTISVPANPSIIRAEPVTINNPPQQLSVTVGTNPVGRSFTVDGTTYSTTQTFNNWTSGSNHSIGTTTPQTSGNTRWNWSSWSDGGAITHNVSPTSNTTYTANFTTQYYLTMNAGTGGTVSPASNWYNAGQQVQISATPNSGYNFNSWTGSGSGSYSGTNNPATVTMNSPITQSANFTQVQCNYSINPTSRNFDASSNANNFAVTAPAGCTWTATANSSLLDEILGKYTSNFSVFSSNSLLISPTVTFPANTGTLGAVPDAPASQCGTAGTPKDVIFNVSGLSGNITNVEVNTAFGNPMHTWMGDINAVLIAPNGASHTLFGRTGSTTATGCGDSSDLAGPYLFKDSATSPPSGGWWQEATALTDIQALTSGSYRTTNSGGAGATNPMPPTNMNASFAGVTNPNGIWILRLTDFGGGDTGSISAASLTVETGTPPSGWLSITSGSNGNGNGTVNYAVAQNTGASRTGTITISANGQPQATHTVNQSAPPSANVLATVQTSPSGLTIIVDGNMYTSPQTFTWQSGSNHSIGTNSVQGNSSTRYNWSNWNNGNTITHNVAPTTNTTYTANFTTQHYLTMSAGTGGTFTPSSGWYNSGQNVQIFAFPNSGYQFSSWTGNYTGTNNPATIAMNSPMNQTANFSQTPPGRKPFDFDGDGKTDIGIFRPSNGQWWINRSLTNQTITSQFGISSDKIVPADFTGDGKTDIAFWRPSTGQWFILRSENNSFYAFPFGSLGDIPAPGDFDGDGKADAAVFRPSNSTWYIERSSGGTSIQQFGLLGDVPVTADYDGDGKSDIAIYRPSVGEWWILRSAAGLIAYQFGSSGDKTVQGDYTGDGKADVAVWRPSNGFWYILRSENNSFFAFPFGSPGDLAVPGDYDGDGKSDGAVFRPSNSTWYLQRTTGGFTAIAFGITGDQPIPNAFVR